MAVSGLRISWATPAASVPSEASFSFRAAQSAAFAQLDAQRTNHAAINRHDAGSHHDDQQPHLHDQQLLQPSERAPRIFMNCVCALRSATFNFSHRPRMGAASFSTCSSKGVVEASVPDCAGSDIRLVVLRQVKFRKPPPSAPSIRALSLW